MRGLIVLALALGGCASLPNHPPNLFVRLGQDRVQCASEFTPAPNARFDVFVWHSNAPEAPIFFNINGIFEHMLEGNPVHMVYEHLGLGVHVLTIRMGQLETVRKLEVIDCRPENLG